MTGIWKTPLADMRWTALMRAPALTVLDEIERSSVDFYATVRSLYQQNRASEIANGVTNIDELPDLDELDDLDDF